MMDNMDKWESPWAWTVERQLGYDIVMRYLAPTAPPARLRTSREDLALHERVVGMLNKLEMRMFRYESQY